MFKDAALLLFKIKDKSSGSLVFSIFSNVLLQSFRQSEGLSSYKYKKDKYYAAERLF
jgi:hypothetical protein